MNLERIYQVLLGPHISEKATVSAEKNRQFVFRVRPDANKLEIKTAVEKLFKVQVESVNTTIIKGKTKRFGNRIGRRSDLKKAYVALKDGFDIDFSGPVE